MPKFPYLENEKITGTTSKGCEKVNWVRMYKVLTSGPHLGNRDPFVFVAVINMFGALEEKTT